jgi:hypothetical protein
VSHPRRNDTSSTPLPKPYNLYFTKIGTFYSITVFQDVPCCLVERHQSSAGTCCLHVEGRREIFHIPDSIHTIISAFLLGFYSCSLHYTNFFFFCNNEVFFNKFMQREHIIELHHKNANVYMIQEIKLIGFSHPQWS